MYLMWLLLEFISSIVVKDRIDDPWDSITFMFGIFTLRMNKIKYDGNDLELYAYLYDDSIKILEQGYFNLIVVREVHYCGDMEKPWSELR
jgi:hypothetical protein